MEKPYQEEFASHYVEKKRSAYTMYTSNTFVRPVAEEILSRKLRLNWSICVRLSYC